MVTPPCPDCGHEFFAEQTSIRCPTSGQRYVLEEGRWVLAGVTDEF